MVALAARVRTAFTALGLGDALSKGY